MASLRAYGRQRGRVLHPLLGLLLAVGTCSGVPGEEPRVLLNNGVSMPVMAFGANIWSADTCRRATLDALAAGFRNIWSSELVGADCQRAQAGALRASSVPRSEVFLAGTVNTQGCAGAERCYQETLGQSEGQLRTLGEAALDMLMLDYPPRAPGCRPILGQWRAFEELYASGKARTIAVSNFSPEQLRCIVDNASATVPAVNQMLFAVGHGGSTVVSDNARYGISVQAYTPLGSGALAKNALCKRIGRRHHKSAAQVALRWVVQRNATICTQSAQREHLREDYDIFDFELSDKEMEELNRVGTANWSPFEREEL